MVAGYNLFCFPGRIIKENKILQKIHEILFAAHPFKQRLHVNHVRQIFNQAFPFVKVLKATGATGCRHSGFAARAAASASTSTVPAATS